MWSKEEEEYSSLPQSENGIGQDSRRSSKSFLPKSSTILLASTNIITAIALAIVAFSKHSGRSLEQCGRDLSTISPALEAIKYLPPAHYNGTFRQTNKWRTKPGEHSKEVDRAWYDIEMGAGGIWVTEEERIALNMTGTDENPLHKVPEEEGGGYIAMLEVFHLLHCLNTLRMGLWFNYDKYYKKMDDGVPDENVLTHFDHCVDMLRINLMCTADVTPALFYDNLSDPRRRDGLPKWSTLHTCRDFDAILDWNKHGPRSIRWRDAGSNPAWDPTLEGADPPFPPE